MAGFYPRYPWQPGDSLALLSPQITSGSPWGMPFFYREHLHRETWRSRPHRSRMNATASRPFSVCPGLLSPASISFCVSPICLLHFFFFCINYLTALGWYSPAVNHSLSVSPPTHFFFPLYSDCVFCTHFLSHFFFFFLSFMSLALIAPQA